MKPDFSTLRGIITDENDPIKTNPLPSPVSVSEIEQFASFVNDGINSWIKAGQLLVEMLDKDPHIFKIIRNKYPGISQEILLTFEGIGRKTIYPYLLIDQCPATRRLLTFDYDKQVSIYGTKIDVVTHIKFGKPVIETKRIQELTTYEVDRVFDGTRIRGAVEQGKWFRDSSHYKNGSRPKVNKKHKPLYRLKSDSLKIEQDESPSLPEGIHQHTYENGEMVGVVDFDFDAIDRAAEDESHDKYISALRIMLEWVWKLGVKQTRKPTAAFVRFAAMSAVIYPDCMEGMTYEEIGKEFGITKQAVGKAASDFYETFEVQLSRLRTEHGKENIKKAVTRWHKARGDKMSSNKNVT